MLRSPGVSERVLEWCAEIFGVTVRSKLGQLVASCFGLFVLGLVLSMRWGYAGWALPGILVLLAWAVARQVAAARDEVWRAASDALDDGPSVRSATGRTLAPTTVTLLRLADAIADARRGRYGAAGDPVLRIERELLRPEELQLLSAVLAMIAMGQGSPAHAAHAAALPTGSPELDACLGRTLVADAWNDLPRLAAIQSAWDRAGVTGGPLARLRALVQLRLDRARIETIETPEARDLSDEARAIGDEELAAELDARSRPAPYR